MHVATINPADSTRHESYSALTTGTIAVMKVGRGQWVAENVSGTVSLHTPENDILIGCADRGCGATFGDAVRDLKRRITQRVRAEFPGAAWLEARRVIRDR